jgi:conserved hypothetical protein TIGR02646
MKYIRKGREPNSLTQYRQQQGAYYDGYPQKDELRDSLVKEQKYICCYCMQRINNSTEKMRIEHWNSQSEFPEQQLIYTNLLGACSGNEGQPKNLQHCDVSKGNISIKINPTMSTCEILVKFKANGEIYSNDADINNDLSVTLNLNYQTIVNNRKAVLDIAYNNLAKHKGIWSKDILQKEIDKWEGKYDSEYQPYCQIVIYHLKKKVAKL